MEGLTHFFKIDRGTPEGRLLWSAVVMICCTSHKDKNPDEVMQLLNKEAEFY